MKCLFMLNYEEALNETQNFLAPNHKITILLTQFLAQKIFICTIRVSRPSYVVLWEQFRSTSSRRQNPKNKNRHLMLIRICSMASNRSGTDVWKFPKIHAMGKCYGILKWTSVLELRTAPPRFSIFVFTLFV